MAPKVIQTPIEGFSFYFYSNENNEPIHVHARKEGWDGQILDRTQNCAGR